MAHKMEFPKHMTNRAFNFFVSVNNKSVTILQLRLHSTLIAFRHHKAVQSINMYVERRASLQEP